MVVTTVPLQKITYHRSSGLITTLLTTLKVVHNVTDKNTNTNHPIDNSDPIHSGRTTLLGTSIAVLSGIFLLLFLVYFFVFVCQKWYKKKMCSRNCQHEQIEYLNTKQILNTYGNKALLFGYFCI